MKFYSPAQVADQLGVTEETVRRWWRRGEFTRPRSTKRKLSNRIRISQADLDYFLDMQAVA